MDILTLLLQAINGWPLITYVIGVSVICTFMLGFVQLRHFSTAWKLVLFPPKQAAASKADMTPFQAFINTLSTNLGNGSIAGMATAINMGGPGAAIWVMIIGLLLMAVRYAEVYLSVYFSSHNRSATIGGPMLYLRSVIGGSVLSPLYGILLLLFMFIGSAIQSNSIRISMETTWFVNMYITAGVLFAFMLYVVFGGAARIVKVSDAIVPFKVLIFFVSTAIVLGYHYQQIIPALQLMFQGAFSPLAVAGGVVGFTVQQAMRYGILRSILATESGLGTAAVMFGSTGSNEGVKNGIISMLSTFISTLVCFIIALCIVASGVWSNGLTSTALTISAFSSVFGAFGGWVVSFLSIAFGLGVLVAYAYITREAWIAVARGKLLTVFPAVYCAIVGAGALISVQFLFGLADIITALMLVINLFGILWLLSYVKQGLAQFRG